MPMGTLAQSDPEVARMIDLEVDRQRSGLELIASENFVSPAVLQAMGTPLTNKYAEGLPGKRYYGGCEFVDMVEQCAIDRALLHHVHEFAAAVIAVNFSGLLYHAIHYGVGDDGRIDYAQMQKIARDKKPKMIIAGASAYARIIDFEPFAEVAREIGAKFVVDMAHFAGLVATGYHPSPVPHADAVTSTTHKTLRGPRGGLILCKAEHAKTIDKAMFPGTQGGPLEHIIAAKAVAFKEALDPSFKEYCGQIVRNAQALASALMEHGFDIVSGGTDNHLMLVDLRNKDVTGKVAEKALDAAGITVNKNTVPKETQSPFVTSGIRIGTPAVTTRGMREVEMVQIAKLIDKVIASSGDPAVASGVKEEVLDLTNRFPLYKSFPSMAETK